MSRGRATAPVLVVAILLGSGLSPPLRRPIRSKPIKMIVPFTPGSPVDVLARVVTQSLGPRLGQTVRAREQARRRHHHRHQDRRQRRPRRLHADDRGHELRHLVGDVSQPRLRPAQELRRGRIPGAQPAGAGDHAGRAGEDGQGIHRLCARQSRASSISASDWARCRTCLANTSSCSPRPTSPAFPTKAASRCASTCWAGASR